MVDRDVPATSIRTSRKGFFAKVTAGAAAAVGALAAWVEPALATYKVACCDLALGPPFCSSPSSCPSGWQRHIWYCCQSGALYQCMECNHGPTCYDAPFLCSRADAVYGCV